MSKNLFKYFTRLQIENVKDLTALFRTRLENGTIIFYLTVEDVEHDKKETFWGTFDKNGLSKPLTTFKCLYSPHETAETAMNPPTGKRISAHWQIFDKNKTSRKKLTKDPISGLNIDLDTRIWESKVKTFFKDENGRNKAKIKGYLTAGVSCSIHDSPGQVSGVSNFNIQKEGIFNINNISVINGRTYTAKEETIKAGKRSDYIHGDAPSDEQLTAAGYNIAEILNLKAHRVRADYDLERDLKILSLKGDDDDALIAVNHFINGSGKDLEYGNGSALVQEMRETELFTKFVKHMEKYLEFHLKQTKGYLLSTQPVMNSELVYKAKDEKTGEDKDVPFRLPNYRWYMAAISFADDTSTIIIGGIQAAKVKYQVEFDAKATPTKVKVTHVTFYDCFGGGLDDGIGLKAVAPGLVPFVVLQHYSNAKKPHKYVPYTSIVKIRL
jgi:hypothetical protein